MVDLVAWTVLRVKDDVLDADPRVSKVAVPSAGGLQELLQLGCCVLEPGGTNRFDPNRASGICIFDSLSPEAAEGYRPSKPLLGSASRTSSLTN